MEFGILGPLAVWRDGVEVALGAAKQRALLAAMLLNAGETMPTERLVDALWGEKPPATAVKALQVYISQLRKTLGEGVVETRPLGYVVRVEDGTLDLHRFERMLAEGRRLLDEGAAVEAGVVLREALGLWRGEPLADFRYEAFAANAIGRLDELRVIALEQRLEADLATGRHADAVPELEALVREYPLREGLRGLLMRALYRSGRQADALTVMQDTRTTLRDELGLDPSQALQQLEKAILLHDPALEAAVPSAATLAPAAPAPAVLLAADTRIETRKTVTVLSCELLVDTEPEGRVDPEALSGVTARFAEPAAKTIVRHGGTVDRFVAGEGLAVFGVPVVREDDALRAVRAAVELREQLPRLEAELGGYLRLELRIGVTTGEVVAADAAEGERLVSGGVVGLARRLQQSAAPGEVLLGAETYSAVAHAAAASPVEPGDTRRQATVFRLEFLDPDATALPRRDDTPLIGRARELALIRSAYEEVASGRGARHLTLVGEPGIGKSRLAREFLIEVGGEATVLIGRCPPYGEGITFWPLRELLRDAGRDETVLTGPTHEVFAAARRVLEELARERPVIAALDDVHWAETTFLDLIEYLSARLGDARVLMLCLTRPELAEARPAWLQESGASLRLERLSDADSETLLEAIGAPAAVRTRIVETAEGNPFFVEQLAAIADRSGPDAAMPTSIRGVLHERLDRLGRQERAVLERASVVGRSFTLESVLDLTPTDEHETAHACVLGLTRQRFVRPDTTAGDEGFRFHHALIRDAAYEGIPKATRAELHERVATRLEAEVAEDALVGYHLEQAYLLGHDLGSPDPELGVRARDRLRAAGDAARLRSDMPATISLFERTLALPPDDRARSRLLVALARARITAGEIDRAGVDLEEAIATAQRFGDRPAELLAVIFRQWARSLRGIGPPDESVRLARELIPELEQLGDELTLAWAWWLKSDGDHVACRWEQSADALEHALVHAHAANADADIVRRFSGLLGGTLVVGSTPVPEAVARLEELLRGSGSDRVLRAWLGASLALLLAAQGSFEEARRGCREAIATWDALGMSLTVGEGTAMAAEIEFMAGDESAAEAGYRASIELLSGLDASSPLATVRAQLADMLCTQGRLDEARALAEQAAEHGTDDHAATQVTWRKALCRILLRQDQLDDADLLAREALRLTEAVEFPELRAAALTAAAEVAAARGLGSDARALLEEARELMRAKGHLVALEQLDTALADPVR